MSADPSSPQPPGPCSPKCGHRDSSHAHAHPAGRPLVDLTNQLRSKSRKITGPRQGILDFLRQNRHPATIKEIFASLPKGDCDLATVYRSMHLLRGMGMVQRFDFGDGIARFELVDAGGHAHHHHLVCTECARIIELDECFAAEFEHAIAVRNGFKAVTHKLEFFGICPDCQ